MYGCKSLDFKKHRLSKCKLNVVILVPAGGFGTDESVNISNEFGGHMDPQLFGE